MSKLRAALWFAELDALGLSAGGVESKEEANDMNIGLLARVVKGVFEARPDGPKPKSSCIAESVAVGCCCCC
jgi:hypothetical protein